MRQFTVLREVIGGHVAATKPVQTEAEGEADLAGDRVFQWRAAIFNAGELVAGETDDVGEGGLRIFDAFAKRLEPGANFPLTLIHFPIVQGHARTVANRNAIDNTQFLCFFLFRPRRTREAEVIEAEQT